MIFSIKDAAVNDSQLAGVAEKEIQANNTRKVLKISIVAPDNRVLINGFKAYFRDNTAVKVIHSDRKLLRALLWWQGQKKSKWPQVFLLGIGRDIITSLEMVVRLKAMKKRCKIIIMGNQDDDINASQYLAAGADGYINLGVENVDWIKAVVTVFRENKVYIRNLKND